MKKQPWMKNKYIFLLKTNRANLAKFSFKPKGYDLYKIQN